MADELTDLLAQARQMATQREARKTGGVVVNGKICVRPQGAPANREKIPPVKRGTHRRRAQVVGRHMNEMWNVDAETREVYRLVGLRGARS